MSLLRSILFVPGHKPEWVAKAWRSGADALILDLEDAVPGSHKAQAREAAAGVLRSPEAEGKTFWIRINSLASGMAIEDLSAVVGPNLSAVVLPKVSREKELAELDAYLTHLEGRAGLEEGSISTPLVLETALAMLKAFDLAQSAPRVDALIAAAGAGADAARALGYQWTKQGTETLFLRSKILLEARAAGVRPLITSWWDIKDLEGLRADAGLNRRLGYEGMVLIHPGHVAVVNDVFSPSPEEISWCRGLLAAAAEAEKEGRGAIVFQGDMVDAAMVKTARDKLELARRIGLAV